MCTNIMPYLVSVWQQSFKICY
uniref:Uncharacterized protein n=1 Tax=Arundo donax TaxID=35708 RepID=A0A0A9GPR0_ARUDO